MASLPYSIKEKNMAYHDNRIRESVWNLIHYTPDDLRTMRFLVNGVTYLVRSDKTEPIVEISRSTNGKILYLTTNGGKTWSGHGSQGEIHDILKVVVAEVLEIRENRKKQKDDQERNDKDVFIRPPVTGMVVDMNWLTNGEEDPFPKYASRTRDSLCMADMSDDVLANYAFLNYSRNEDDELKALLSMGVIPTKIAFMTAVKERLRWLSRRVAILEGRYPVLKRGEVHVMGALTSPDKRVLSANSELIMMPGFFFQPIVSDGLEELTMDQRFDLLENQGNYTLSLYRNYPVYEEVLLIACDNGHIPTHRRPDAKIPGYGDVPICTRDQI